MADLIYTAQLSLDGYIADEHGKFQWAVPDDDVLAFINDQERPIGTYLYGRRLYEVMAFWETFPMDPAQPQLMREFAELWRAPDKIVYSTTLQKPTTARTRIESTFDPAAVRAMKDAADRDIGIGGPALAAGALRAGLVDELRLLIYPLTVGGGNPYLPDGLRLNLQLLDEHRFAGGVVYLRYRISP
jgi:dihydrofolate reductase